MDSLKRCWSFRVTRLFHLVTCWNCWKRYEKYAIHWDTDKSEIQRENNFLKRRVLRTGGVKKAEVKATVSRMQRYYWIIFGIFSTLAPLNSRFPFDLDYSRVFQKLGYCDINFIWMKWKRRETRAWQEASAVKDGPTLSKNRRDGASSDGNIRKNVHSWVRAVVSLEKDHFSSALETRWRGFYSL